MNMTENNSSLHQPARLGILGGSFNPIHLGHLAMGHSAAEAFSLERVLVIPCSLSPFKRGCRDMASAEDRTEMVKRSIAGDPLYSFCGIELERGGISYAVETVRALHAVYPGSALFFIIGADSLLGLSGWYEVDALLSLCEMITVCRPGVAMPEADALRFPRKIAERLLGHVVEGKHCDVSSSEIRERLCRGLSVRGLVPPAVEAFLEEKKLYR